MRCALVLVACFAGAAHADTDPKQAEAEALYTEGSAHYNVGEYRVAIDAFKRAYALYPEPTFLFDIGQAYRLMHDCENAAVFYRSYARAAGDGEDRANAEKLAAEMDACVADHKPAHDERPPQHRGLRLAAILTAGVGIALAGSGVVFSFKARDDGHQVESMCNPSCNATDVASIDRAGKSASKIAMALYVTGGVAITAGASMIVWATLHADPETIMVAPTPGGATVSTAIHF